MLVSAIAAHMNMIYETGDGFDFSRSYNVVPARHSHFVVLLVHELLLAVLKDCSCLQW